MEMLRNAIRPEILASLRGELEARDRNMLRQMKPIREKRDFDKEADRRAFEKRRVQKVS